MDTFITDLLGRLAGAESTDQHAGIIAEALAAQPSLAAAEIHDQLAAKFNELQGDGSGLTDEILGQMDLLGTIADGVTAEMGARQGRADRAKELQDRIAGLAQAGDDEDQADEPAVEEPAAPVVELPEQASPVDAVPAPEAPVAVAASGIRPRVPISSMKSSRKAPEKDPRGKTTFTVVASGDVPGFSTGQSLDGLDGLGAAMTAKFAGLVRAGISHRAGVAVINREASEERTLSSFEATEADVAKMDNAANELLLPGGSLVAAGGWCAPSETLYDLCPDTISRDGMLQLPSMVAKRGGVRYPQETDLADLWAGIGFHQTEAQAEAGTKKTCYELPCEDMSECRMDVDGVCLRSPILANAAWPERTKKFLKQALAIHAHKLNAFRIKQAAAAATKVTMAAIVPGAAGAPAFAPHGPGMTESLLSGIELQVQYIRYIGRLSQNTSLELVAPFWLRGILRADLSQKSGVDLHQVTDAMLDAYLRLRGVSPQWVYDWQDSFSGTSSDFGGTVPTVWPSKAQVLIYAAGTYMSLEAPVINLDAVYDHASLETNMFTSLFTEEGVQVCRRCGPAILLEATLCPTGASGAQLLATCTAPSP